MLPTPYLCVDDLVDHSRLAGHEQYRSKSDPARATPSSRDMSFFTTYPLDTSGGQRLQLTSWEDISRLFTEHLEVRLFLQLPPSKQPSSWNERRKHAPFSVAVPPGWDLDFLYLRHPDERASCESLRRLTVDPSMTSVSLNLVCLDSLWVPFRWSHPHRRIEVNRRRFP
jgi:hypothetical protein